MPENSPFGSSHQRVKRNPLFSARTFAKLRLSQSGMLDATTHAAVIAALLAGPIAISGSAAIAASPSPGDSPVYKSPAVQHALTGLGLEFPLSSAGANSQFQVNTYTTGTQFLPSVAMDSDGDFVVAWSSYGSDGTDTDEFSIQASWIAGIKNRINLPIVIK